MKSISETFYALKRNNNSDDNRYAIMSLSVAKSHKIGISAIGQPIFFIKCENPSNLKILDSALEFITVRYNRECELINEDKKSIKGNYTIILLSSDSFELQSYFLDIVSLLINKIKETPSLGELKIEVDKIINLFSKLAKPATKTIQGLWAELLAIENSCNPDYMIKSWHQTANDRFDFNDGKDKIEVKSTSKSRRTHRFSLEQLIPNKNSRLIIVSIFAIETGTGKTIFDLIKMIEKKASLENSLRINEIVAETLGKDLEKSFNVFFDYQYGIDSIAYFESTDIPSIDGALIANELSNISFDCDLTALSSIEGIDYLSALHSALFTKET